MSSKSSILVVALGASVVIAVVAIVLPKWVISEAAQKILVTQSLELLLALAAVAVFGKGRFADYGFRMPRPAGSGRDALLRWIPVGLTALGIGAVATLALLITGASGNPLVKELSFFQIVVLVWGLASIIEEIFTRGFLQGHLEKAFDPADRIPLLRVAPPVFISALFFSAMHLTLLLSSADTKTVVIILLFTFSLGLLAAHQRAKTGSLVPAIGVHMLGNIGGVIAGIIYAVVMLLTGGRLPGS